MIAFKDHWLRLAALRRRVTLDDLRRVLSTHEMTETNVAEWFHLFAAGGDGHVAPHAP